MPNLDNEKSLKQQTPLKTLVKETKFCTFFGGDRRPLVAD